jgi:hypothetical protein
MINLRYHIVSLTAVFLALGLGILAGTTVIDQGLVSSLRANTRALRGELNTVKGNVSDLQKQLRVWDEFGKSISTSLLQGQLAGRAVVLVADAKVPGPLMSALAEAFRLSNAKRPTRMTLTAKWTLDGTETVGELATAAGVSARDRGTIVSAAAERIGSRLAGSSDPRTETDAIRRLTDADFIDVADLPGSGPFPAANAVVVVVSSGDAQEAPAPDDFFIPFLKALSATRIACAVEPITADQSIVELVRGDRGMARSVCTADHVDTVAGRLSLVYALRSLIDGRSAEHYGIRGGTPIAPVLRPA